MKIAFITDGIPPQMMGGMQTHSLQLVRGLVHLGIAVDIYHSFSGDCLPIDALELFKQNERGLVSSSSIPWPTGDRLPGHYLRESDRFSSLVYEEFQARTPVDFVYVQGFVGRAFFRARRTGNLQVPVGANMHGLNMFQAPACLKDWLYQGIMRRRVAWDYLNSDVVFSFSDFICELSCNILQGRSEKVEVVPNGIETDWIIDKVSDSEGTFIRFAFVGRFERVKAVQEIHEAIQTLRHGKNWEFEFVGPIPEDKHLKHPQVLYHGSVADRDQMKEILDRCDVLVCPSYSEGMPTVILEAMARGLAILATDVGAVRCMVGDDNGILLPKVSVVGIREAMSRFVQMPTAELEQKKRASLEKVREFTWDKVAELTERAMTRAIERCAAESGVDRKNR